MPTKQQIDEVTKHYIIACLWADCPEGTHPRATKQAYAQARKDVEAFISECGELFTQAIENESYGWFDGQRNALAQFGHDFYLTRQGHGAGFWDREALKENDLGDKLSALCGWESAHFKEVYPQFYRGWLYFN